MIRAREPNIKNLSELQKSILKWLFQEFGYHTVQTVLTHLHGSFEDFLHGQLEVSEDGRRLGAVGTLVANAVTRARQHQEESIQLHHRGIKWEAKRFLGASPTRAESATLSASLKNLEERGLIRRTRSRGKRKNVSHINFTEAGVVLARELYRGKS